MTKYSPIIGDLVEEYREVALPTRGRLFATIWFVRQLASLAPAWLWGGKLLSAAFVGRIVLDRLVPTTHFELRARTLSVLVIATLIAVGARGAWRSGSLARGTLNGAGAAAFGALLSALGTLFLLAAWGDARTMASIHASGGLAEAFELPVMMILPGAVLGALGASASIVVRRLRSA